MTSAQLEGAVAGAASLLEADAAAPTAFKRLCPHCKTPMASLRIGTMSAWVERCERCDCDWVEPADVRTLQMMVKSSARTAAWSSRPAHEREAIAHDLANAVQAEERPASISAGDALLAAAGVPVLQKVTGVNAPFVTWGVCLAMMAAQLAGLSLELAVTTVFFLVFGGSAERVLPRWLFGALLIVVGAAGASQGPVVGVANALVAACIAVCLLVQRSARVMVFGLRFFSVPLWLYAGVWVLLQLGWLSFNPESAVWAPSLFGFTAGLIAGIFEQRRFVPR